MRIIKRKGTQIALAVAAVAGTGSIGGVFAASPAHADPAWASSSKPLVAVGSNTIEDLYDGFAGVVPTPGLAPTGEGYHTFTPLSDPSTAEQVYSWDAINPNPTVGIGDCISAKPGFAPIARPNGSGDGRKALSDAITNSLWSKTTSVGNCAPQTPNGQIDIARSSSSPSSSKLANCASATSTCLAWIDIAHDAVSYAYVIKSGSTTTASQVDHLSNAQLTSLYTSSSGTYTDPATGVTYAACLPQFGSGTESFFLGKLNGGSGVTATQAEPAATAANCVGFEENGANTFLTNANNALSTDSTFTTPPTVAVTPFSVGSWISQNNKVAFDRSTTGVAGGVALGYIDGSTSGLLPYQGTAPNESPNSTFYSGTYGRDLYSIVSNAVLNGRATTQNSEFQHIFGYLGTAWGTFGGPQSNATSGSGQICSSSIQNTMLPLFGFTSPSTCGAETLTTTDPAGTTGA